MEEITGRCEHQEAKVLESTLGFRRPQLDIGEYLNRRYTVEIRNSVRNNVTTLYAFQKNLILLMVLLILFLKVYNFYQSNFLKGKAKEVRKKRENATSCQVYYVN